MRKDGMTVIKDDINPIEICSGVKETIPNLRPC